MRIKHRSCHTTKPCLFPVVPVQLRTDSPKKVLAIEKKLPRPRPHFFGDASAPALALTARPLAHVFATFFTIALRPSPRTSTYTSTTLRIVPAANAAFSPAVAPYLCATAAVTAAPPASASRTVDAASEARMIVAESATLALVPSGLGDCGDGEGEGEGVRDRELPSRGGRTGLVLSDGRK